MEKIENIQILAVDDSKDTLEIVERNLSEAGYSVQTAESVHEALGYIKSGNTDILITDWKMPKVSGMELTKYVSDNFPEISVMMITGYATLEGAVEAVKTGVDEYLAKPFTEEELKSKVKKLAEKVLIGRKSRNISIKGNKNILPGMVWVSEEMDYLSTRIIKASSVPATVLITGESGTGKELVARAIHYNSSRSSSPFVPINCGAIPEALMESELFGFVKGAFTGADSSRSGFFQTADTGTIFLDEISETSLPMQVKLLRVLQEKEVYMVGSSRPYAVDVRIIAATNKDLFSLVEKGRFREDLFYRLNVLTFEVPPLRKRKEDIPILINHFIKKFSDDYGIEEPVFNDGITDTMKQYSWPGNVRELENIIQRMVVMRSSNELTARDLPDFMRYSLPDEDIPLYSLRELEIRHIERVLKSVQGNKTKAASILGVDRKTLREKLKKSADK